ncbi:MAG: hypothetical protein AMJ79_14055 [Phycisphaerae bacterium SM23_30]|nr:MAG: hypothetical protein AMJ79_14055 [Phycisphaerae bacterium SM23_30]
MCGQIAIKWQKVILFVKKNNILICLIVKIVVFYTYIFLLLWARERVIFSLSLAFLWDVLFSGRIL